MGHTDVSGYDLHAFVDGELGADGRRRRVIARLATDPAAAKRVAAYARQRAVLAALEKALVLAPPPALLGELVRALRRAAALHRVSPPPLPGTTAP
jgi:anti-sigma factor RsiW